MDLLINNKNSLFPLVQCCSKPEQAMSGNAGHEWSSKLAINIEKGDSGCESHSPCQNWKKTENVFLKTQKVFLCPILKEATQACLLAKFGALLCI